MSYLEAVGEEALSDLELEMLKLKRLKELERKSRGEARMEAESPKPQPSPMEIVEKWLVGRAKEVLEAAKVQHPPVAKEVVENLAELARRGILRRPVTGEMLMEIFRRAGYPVRLSTKILFQKRGKVKTLDEKIKEASF